MKRLSRSSSGFTIMELLIATTVFSVVLLGALAGFLQIGDLFYKGISTTNTQAVTNQILQDVSGQFQTNDSFISVPVTPVLPTTSQIEYAYYCIGGTRYTYIINHELVTSDPSDHSPKDNGFGNFALLKDNLPGGGSGCAAPCDDDTVATPICPPSSKRFINPVEMLGEKMRLSQFEITPTASGSSYNISIVVAYGKDDALTNIMDPGSIACDSNSGIKQFCSVSRLDTSVYKGFNL